jgi:membrane protease subunit (stomatin/prohibitin family)
MAILDVIEFFDDSGEIIVARFPQEGSGEFRLGSQLVVQESQLAIFYRDGRGLDEFGAGRYTLESRNLPLLTKIVALPFGGKSPFRCYVYFLGLKTFINLGWGTPTPVLFRDAEFRMVTLRAHGMYSIRVSKPRLFLQTLVGTKGLENTFALQEFFRQVIVSQINEVIGKSLKSILDLPVQYSDIAATIKNAVRLDFEQYGVELVDLVVEAITVPPEVQAMINRATGVAAQDVQKYRDVAAADAMRDAARNPGTVGEGMGAGLGLGLGLSMARQLTNTPTPAQATNSGAAPATDIRSRLQELKAMKDDGLITESEYTESKARLLAHM